MADYVRKTILSQAYVHIERVHLTEQEKKDFELNLSVYQKPRAKILLGADIVPEVKTSDGSLVVHSTVYGSLSDALGNHDDFQKSLAALYGSSRMLADACVLESLFLAEGKKRDLIRSEARTGVVRTTKELFDKIGLLAEVKQQESHKRLNSVLFDIEKKVIFLNNQLTLGRDRALVWGNFLPLLQKLFGVLHLLPKTPDDIQLKTYRAFVTDLGKEVTKFQVQGDDPDMSDI